MEIGIYLKRWNRRFFRRYSPSFKSMGFRPKLPVKFEDLLSEEKRRHWIEDKEMVAFTMYSPEQPFLPVDIIIKETIYFKKVFKDRVKLRADNTTIPLIPLKELIAMKEGSPHPQERKTTPPLLYYRTDEQIERHRRRPAIQKLRCLEEQMRFFQLAMPERAKRIREELKKGKAVESRYIVCCHNPPP